MVYDDELSKFNQVVNLITTCWRWYLFGNRLSQPLMLDMWGPLIWWTCSPQSPWVREIKTRSVLQGKHNIHALSCLRAALNILFCHYTVCRGLGCFYILQHSMLVHNIGDINGNLTLLAGSGQYSRHPNKGQTSVKNSQQNPLWY